MNLTEDFDLTCLFHLENKVDVVPGELGALRMARELQRIRSYCLCLLFQEGDHEVDCVAGNDLRAHALHYIANW